jgi:hypothetical protein
MSSCKHSITDDGQSLLICTECGLEIDASFDESILEGAAQEAFECGGTEDGSYLLSADDFDQIVGQAIYNAIVMRELAK